MYIVDGAYNLTPQEYIDFVNKTVEAQNNGEYMTIPEFEESGSTIGLLWVRISPAD